MLLTITTTHDPATELGYLLHKNPARLHTFELPFGSAHVFYPEATAERCAATLLLDVDPVGLVRGNRASGGGGRSLAQYVNDRPYVASSFLSVAIARVFGSALGGRSKDRPELAETPIPLRAKLAVLPCRGGEPFLRRLFEPLGYAVEATRHPLDPQFPEWGESAYFTVEIEAVVRLSDLLSHLYVLVPVLDNEKHYYVGDDEVEKLLRRGEGWLSGHPEREAIARRYLKFQPSLAREAIARLVADEAPDADAAVERNDAEEAAVEAEVAKRGLNELRIGAVIDALKESGATSVIDLGCGEGRLLKAFLEEKTFTRVAGSDVSCRALEIAAARLRLDRMSEKQRGRLELFQSSLTYRDRRLESFDAAAVVEVVEHLDPDRLAAFERSVFEFARPATVALTTPNAEYNVKFESLPAGALRHRDHRFEWTRAEFEAWASGVAERFGYGVRYVPVGPVDEAVGAPTQMAIFSRPLSAVSPATPARPPSANTDSGDSGQRTADAPGSRATQRT